MISSEADYFAVSSAEEFFEINSVTDKPIIILDPVFDKDKLKALIEAGAELTVCNLESFKILNLVASETLKAKIHIAVNTGMNRFGFKSKSEFLEVVSIIKKSHNFEIKGVFSHFFDAKNINFAENQYKLFKEYEKIFYQNFDKKVIFHLSNSDGLFYKNGFDMARVGMKIYSDNLYPTISLKAKILDIQTLNKGETAGYSAVFVAERDTRLAVTNIGYGDGIPRNIYKNGYVLIHGKYARIVAVCMDSILIDLKDIDAKVGDEVVLIGKSHENQIFICDVAAWCDTIDYEIITRLASRVERKLVD